MADDRSGTGGGAGARTGAAAGAAAAGASRVEAGDVALRSFGTVRRGFDQREVRAYLELLAKALEHAGRREQELLEMLEEAEERARHPVIDESVLTSSLGQRSAAVLRGAHEEAARILSQAEETAATMVRDAQQQATDIQVNAESSVAERIAEAELEASSLRQQSRDEAAAVLETAREEGESVVERAREHGRAMLDQAQEARRRVLADMAHRRRLVTEQIELFRSARDEIAGSVVGVRRSLDRIVEDLSRAEDSARAAASSAARPRSVDVPEPVLVEEAERAVAELDSLGGGGGGAQPAPHPRPARHPQPESASTVLRFDDVATVIEKPAPGAHDEVVRGEDEPAEDEPAEDEPAVSSGPRSGGTDVEGLFAKLRARRQAGADDVPSASGPAAGLGEAAETDLDLDVDAAGEADPQAAEAHNGTGEPGPEPDPEPSQDAEAFARRAGSLDPIVTTLARRMKRALQDDQNRLLDRLRQGTAEWSDELLVDEESQQSLYADAAASPVRDAVSAGSAFARALVGGRQSKRSTPDERAVDEVTRELATSVVTLIRRRLESGETPDLAERVGAAYREWRGERIERLAEDSAVEAFSKGVLAGAGRHRVRWSRSEVGPGCADCEDNALAGVVAPGDEFPTGHRHPPAHAGCRCLVLPDPNSSRPAS